MPNLMKIEFYEQITPYGKTLRMRPLGLHMPRVSSVEDLTHRSIPLDFVECEDRRILIDRPLFRLCYADAFAEGVDPDTVFQVMS